MSRSDPLSRHALPRWQTRFGQWIGDVGVPRIVEELAGDPDIRVTKSAVYKWLEGHAPTPDRAGALVQLARRIEDPLSMEAIYSHRFELKKLRRQRTAETREV